MAEEEVSQLKIDFYRDGFGRILIAIFLTLAAILLLGLISAYLFLTHPEPVVFSVDNDWRVLPPVPIDQAYIKDPDLLQWVSQVLPSVFTFDFVNYKTQLDEARQYFSDNGWKVFLNQLDTYANNNTLQAAKMFVNANPSGAPIVLNRGILDDRYAWWIQIPMKLSYSSPGGTSVKPLVFQILVVRIPTLDNLDGVTIDNVVIKPGEGTQINAKG